MKHIKICKPKTKEAKNSIGPAATADQVKEVKNPVRHSLGFGCVPTGNLIDLG